MLLCIKTSSAYSLYTVSMLQSRQSMNNKKSRGPRIDPCGIPEVTKCQVTKFVLNNHLLSSTDKKLLNPLQVGSMDTIAVKFTDQLVMRHLVTGLRKVQKKNNNLFACINYVRLCHAVFQLISCISHGWFSLTHAEHQTSNSYFQDVCKLILDGVVVKDIGLQLAGFSVIFLETRGNMCGFPITGD